MTKHQPKQDLEASNPKEEYRYQGCPTGACPKNPHNGNCGCKCHHQSPKKECCKQCKRRTSDNATWAFFCVNPKKCKCHQSPDKCKHKNSIPCNRNSCDGVDFVHYFHCEDCGEALKPESPDNGVGWEKEWDKKFGLKYNHISLSPKVIKSFIRNLLKRTEGNSYADGYGIGLKDGEKLSHSKETHKGESYRKGYQQGIKESRSQVLEQIKEELKHIAMYHPEDKPNCYSVADVLDILERLKK